MMSELKSRDLEFFTAASGHALRYLSINSPLAQQREIDIKDLEGQGFLCSMSSETPPCGFTLKRFWTRLPFEKKVYIRDRGTMEDVIAENPLSFGIGTGALIATSG